MTEPSEQYWASFGRFINRFAETEQRLHSLLWEISGASIEVARAAFGDARYDKIVTLINRINDSRGEDEHPLFRRAVEQMGLISRMRNDLVHLGIALTDKGGMVSNHVKAMPGRAKAFTITADMLDKMTADLKVITACITVCHIDRFGLPPDARELPFRDVAQRPWMYKPPPQSHEARGRRKPLSKRTHRPAAQRE
ncbi:MAG TPA: hypothetical protein VGO55_01105 [Allosphingosinicella sp.]|nr:hypothetical protein [Allosphingosinicella sp.]